MYQGVIDFTAKETECLPCGCYAKLYWQWYVGDPLPRRVVVTGICPCGAHCNVKDIDRLCDEAFAAAMQRLNESRAERGLCTID